MTAVNPWTALMQPIRSRPGDRPRTPPSPPAKRKAVAAAALVITYSGVHDRPDVRLLPIIAIDFALDQNYWL